MAKGEDANAAWGMSKRVVDRKRRACQGKEERKQTQRKRMSERIVCLRYRTRIRQQMILCTIENKKDKGSRQRKKKPRISMKKSEDGEGGRGDMAIRCVSLLLLILLLLLLMWWFPPRQRHVCRDPGMN